MIVCTQCGNHNQDDDEFCGSCGKFLEWVGEKVEEPPPPAAPEPDVEEEPERRGIVSRVRSAVGFDEEPDVTTEHQEAPGRAEMEAAEAEAAEEQRRRAAEAEAQHLAEDAARHAAAEEEARQQAETAERERQAAAERERQAAAAEEQRRAEEDAARRRAAEEDAARRAAEEVAQQRAEEAEAQLKAENAEARERAEEEAEAQRKAEEAEAQRKAEEAEAQRKAEEAEAQRKAEEEATRRAAEEAAEAQRRAEEEARAKEEADRKAAALLSRPRAQAPTAAPPTPPPDVRRPSQPDPAASRPGEEAHEVPAGDEAAEPTRGRQPVAQQPAARQAPRPAPKKVAPQRQVKPGDLICGQCGEGNDPQRRFCRKCGNSLAEAPVAARPPWWRRLFSRDKSKERGRDRTKTKTTRDRARGATGAARSAGWQANRARYVVRRVLMLLVLVGVAGAFILPGPRGAITDRVSGWYTKAKLALIPEFEEVNATGVDATSALPGHEPGNLIDGHFNTYWAEGVPGPGVDQIVTVTFGEPTDVDKLIVTSGVSGEDDPFLSQSRPRVLHIVYDTGKGMDLELRDVKDATTYDLEDATGVTTIQFQIAAVYPSAEGGENTGISELEFRRRKRG